jgi:5-methylthioadenosine/S-adenosylhomocysteine deaminase
VCELIAGGVTCINDMGTVHGTEITAGVLEDTGIRAVIGKALMDQGQGVPPRLLERSRDALAGAIGLADRYHGAAGGRLQVSLAPRFILSCSEPLWRDVTDCSRERGLLVHYARRRESDGGARGRAAVQHTAARYFATHGVLSERFVGAHGVWLEPDELAAFRAADAALVHCPGSNLKLGSGFAHVRAWRDAGIRCGIGSDGAACNNRLDTFGEMSLVAGISRVVDPLRPLGAREVIELATRRGAEALGLGDRIGSLEPGKQADVIVLDARAPELAPNAHVDPYTTVVHSMTPAHVRLTMVAGRILYRDGAWTTLDPIASGAMPAPRRAVSWPGSAPPDGRVPNGAARAHALTAGAHRVARPLPQPPAPTPCAVRALAVRHGAARGLQCSRSRRATQSSRTTPTTTTVATRRTRHEAHHLDAVRAGTRRRVCHRRRRAVVQSARRSPRGSPGGAHSPGVPSRPAHAARGEAPAARPASRAPHGVALRT